jgi:uncharacterized DUF497 family protein
MDFDWDDAKDETNYKKHNVHFSEAATVWFDTNAVEFFDPDHSEYENRYIRVGTSSKIRILAIIFFEVIELDRIRIISARKATKKERELYEKGI